MIAERLVKSESKEARLLAEDIAVRRIRSNYTPCKETGTMHEKYDVEKCGAFGGGGEYVPQEFGWPKDLKLKITQTTISKIKTHRPGCSSECLKSDYIQL